jgi:dTDP-4-dehydrorhamnose reductase
MSKVLCANFSLIQAWISALLNGVEIFPFSDLYMAPISTESVMQSLIQISTAKIPGIYQFSANDDINYIEAANVIADTLSLDKTLIVSTYGRDNKILPQNLERHHTLDCSRAISELRFQCPDPGELTAEVAIETYKTISEQEKIYHPFYGN